MNPPPRILFIDDDPQVREFVEDILRTNFPGIHIAMAKDLTSFRLALESGGFHVVLTDYELGWTDGLTIFRAVKVRYPDCPVIMFTASGDEELAVEAMKAGLDDYILKSPKHAARLPAAIRQVLKQAEERRLRQETEAQNRTLINDVLETSATGVIILDSDFRVVWINGAIEQYFGLKRAEMLGQDKRRLISATIKAIFEDSEGFERRVLETYRNNHCTEAFDCHILAGDGRQTRWLEHRSMPITTGLYAGGRIEHYYDITARKQAEAALQVSETKFRQLAENIHQVFWMTTPDKDRILYVSPAYEEIWGRSCASVYASPRSWLEAIHPDDRARVLRSALADQEAGRYEQEYRILRPDGTTRWILDKAFPIRDGSGHVARIAGVAEDITPRKEAEEAIKASEDKYHGLFETSQDGIVFGSLEGRIEDANPAFIQMLGYSLDELRDMTYQQFTPSRWAEMEAEIVRDKIFKEGYSGEYQKEYLRKDGSVLPVAIRVWLIRDEQGHPKRLYAVVRDLTAEKQAALALERSEEQYRLLFNSNPHPMWAYDLDTLAFLAVNDAAVAQYGYSKAEFLGMTIKDIRPPEDIPALLANVSKVTTGLDRAGMWRHRKKDGTLIDVQIAAHTVMLGGRRAEIVLAVDVTEQQAVEAALHETRDRLDAIIQFSPVAITMLDPQGYVLVWNPAAARLFGWSAEEVFGHRLPTVPREGLEEHETIIRRLLAGEALSGLELVRQRKDGSKVAISLWASPLRSPEGEVTGIIGVMHDVTERKLMERHAARIERMAALGQLLSGVAHELKNPLFVLSGRLQLIKEKLAAGQQDTLAHDLEKVEEAAKRMTHVTERFLTMARPLPPRQTACALPALLDQTLEFMANELMKSKVEVTTDIQRDLPSIMADPRLLQEAFLNLMLNAMHAMVTVHQRGRLTVAARQVSEWIEIRIEDDGPGIPPEHRGRLFEPFFSTKPAGEGTGLGLWTVRTIVEGMKGQVAYETEIDRGTTFIIRLPVNGGNGGKL